MSAGRPLVSVECDDCRKVEEFTAPTLADAQRAIDEEGWLRNVARDQDLCPSCVAGRVGANVPRMLL